MRTRPVDPAELYRLPPQPAGIGEHAGWKYWIVKYDSHPDPLVEAWMVTPYVSHCVWMPGATRAAVKAWIETLEMPVAKKAKAA